MMDDLAVDLLSRLLWASVFLAGTGVLACVMFRLLQVKSPGIRETIWWVVLLHGMLLLRVTLAIPWYEPGGTVEVTSAIPVRLMPGQSLNDTAVEPMVGPPSAVSEAAIGKPSAFRWPLLVSAVWLGGVLFILAWWTWGYTAFLRACRCRPCDRRDWTEQWETLLKDVGVEESIPIHLGYGVGPALCLHPSGYRLIVPVRLWRRLSSEQRRCVMQHELAHYRRGDVWRLIFARLLALPHWFNPLAWHAVGAIELASEYACDDFARRGGRECATGYARMLLAIGESVNRPPAWTTGGGGGCLFKRISRVLSTSEAKDSVMKKALILVVFLVATLATVVRVELVAQESSQRADESSSASVGESTEAAKDTDQVPQQDAAEDDGGLGDNCVTLDQVVAAWKKREERVRSVRFQWQGESGDQLVDGDGILHPNALSWSLVLDGQLIRHSSYGKKLVEDDRGPAFIDQPYTSVFGKENVWQHFGKSRQKGRVRIVPTGSVYHASKCGYIEKQNFHVNPIVLHYRALDDVLSPIEGPLTLSDKTGVVNGQRCLVVNENGIRKREYWIDPEREFAITRFREFSPRYPDKTWVQFDVAYKRDPYHGWVPSGWKGSLVFAESGKLRGAWDYTVTSYAINLRVEPREFEYEFPPDTWVNDYRDDSMHIVRAGGGKRVVKKSELVVGYEKLLRTESGKAIPADYRALKRQIGALADQDAAHRQRTLDELRKYLAGKPANERFPGDYALLIRVAYALKGVDNTDLAIELCQSVIPLFGKPDQEKIRVLVNFLEGEERRRSLPGRAMKVVGTTVDGTQFDWSSYRGKVVLIDFWFMACPPCMAELPKVKRAYDQYHSRGFDVVGISVDQDQQALKKFLDEKQIPWTNLYQVSDELQPTVKYYAIRSFPTQILVDKDGKVISLKAEGKELMELLARVLGPAGEDQVAPGESPK